MSDPKPGYDPSDRLNSPDTDWLEEKAQEAIRLHRETIAANTKAAIDKAAEVVSDTLDDAVDAINSGGTALLQEVEKAEDQAETILEKSDESAKG